MFNKILLLVSSLSLAISIIVKAQTYEKTDLGVKSKINSVEIEILFYAFLFLQQV